MYNLEQTKIKNIIIFFIVIVFLPACFGRRNNNAQQGNSQPQRTSQNIPNTQTRTVTNTTQPIQPNQFGQRNVAGVANTQFNNPRTRMNTTCSWGFVGPKRFNCLNNTYVYGSVMCGVNVRQAFCEQRFSHDVSTCIADNSPNTQSCNQQMQRQRTSSTTDGSVIPDPTCNFGSIGPRFVSCDGKDYAYIGSAICNLQIYNRIFCERRLISNIQSCIADNRADTLLCLGQHFPNGF